MIKKRFLVFFIALLLGILGLFSFFSYGINNVNASHSWNGYHWARTTNPLNLRLGNNLIHPWSGFLQVASADWSVSPILDTMIVAGQSNTKNCRPTLGRVEVCNGKYGNNGWLGIAQVWTSGNHITQGTTKLNDTYFNSVKYNTPAWKQLVICQEIGHTFGIDHQDENFNNNNLGTCMDYTSDPDGTLANPDQLSNEHLNTHDFEQLLSIYAHLDEINTSLNKTTSANTTVDLGNPSAWGKVIRESEDKKSSVFERDFGNGNKVFTFVIWVQ
jgi:hypothetical protein